MTHTKCMCFAFMSVCYSNWIKIGQQDKTGGCPGDSEFDEAKIYLTAVDERPCVLHKNRQLW